MDKLLGALGFLIIVLFLAASLNGFKKYLSEDSRKFISKNHQYFGMAASFFAVVHMVIAITLGELRVTGLLALLALIGTGVMGMLFKKLKKKNFYVLHRIFGVFAVVMIIIHIVFNSQY